MRPMRRTSMKVIMALSLLGAFLSACDTLPTEPPASPAATATTTTMDTPDPTTPTPTPLPTPTPTPAPNVLTICQAQEPTTLYWYGGGYQANRSVQQALYDGPIDNRTYAYQPVILERLPDFQNGDAQLKTVIVQAGDEVVDDANTPVLIEEGMFVRPAGCYAPECAIEFTGEPVEMDQMIVSFTLLEGVTWSDGEPVTAADSVYGFELDSNPQTPTSKYTVNRTVSYEAVNDRTVEWTGLPGYFDSLYFTNFWMPMPVHLWKETLNYTPGDLLEAEESHRKPLGWGAYSVKEWVAGDHITLEKNAAYFRAGEGLPAFNVVIFRFVPDANNALAQLLSGECDIITGQTELSDMAPLMMRLEEQGLVSPVFAPEARWEHISFGIDPARDYNRPDFFQDVRVRQAIAFCMNRQEVINLQLFGSVPVMDSYLPAEHPLYAGSRLKSYSYSPTRGQALLQETGWIDEDGDGIREAHGVDGIRENTPLAFTWQAPDSMPVHYLDSFQLDLGDCGISVELVELPVTEYFAASQDGPLFGRRFDLGSFAWSTSVEPPPCALYLSSEIPSDDNEWFGQNITGFSNEAYDAACTRALQALPGSQDYIDAHKEAQRIFSEELPALPLFQRITIAAARPEITGMILDPTETSATWNIEAFSLVEP
ncbi:MAG: peptide ABC transporter substrate-binding protein [Anaerolineae bacterium]|nr:peptide ABC transporter substrate-binding protein [Anaerolineae bacterium]